MTRWNADNSDLLLYREQAQAGDVIIGQELQIELDNLAEDIATERYVYNTDAARLRMSFMEHCIRLTKSPFYGRPMRLMQWQKALIEAAFSFRRPDSNRRRFTEILLLIARKNCKSEMSSALGLTEFFLGPPGADIVASSNDDNQASIVYDAIDTMRSLIDPDDRDTRRNQRFIRNLATNTRIYKISERTRNKEGRNIDLAFLDEVHEMKSNSIAMPIRQSQALKDEPLLVQITTEGFVTDGYLDSELKRARSIIYRETPDDPDAECYLPWLYTQDSEQEVWTGNRENRLWMKSNPTLGTVKKWDYLENQVSIARKSKADRIYILNKDFNVKQNTAESWLNLEDYDYESGYDLKRLRGSWALGAVDLSETTDLTCAKILCMKKGDPKKYVYSQYFIPESKLEESDDSQSGAKYKQWAEQGLLTIVPGSDIDLSLVADWFYNVYQEHGIKPWKIGYDQRFARDFINRMEQLGWTKNGSDPDLIMILQNAQTLSNAIKWIESDLKHRLIFYGNNDFDKWCLKNASLKIDNFGQCLIVKQSAGKRIDGAVCLAILYETMRRYRSEYRAIVEK